MNSQDSRRNADATQLMGADPDATQLAGPGPDATQLAGPDANATQLMGAEPAAGADATQLAAGAATSVMTSARTTQLPPRGAAPTTVLGRDGESAADGIDVLDDPLATPIDLDSLTTVRTPVELQSPVKSTKKRRLPVWGVALIVVAVLGALAGAGWYTYKQELWGGHTVPLVVGLDEATASTQLDTAGFKVTVEEAYADEGIGTVISCSPEPGSRAETSGGATITIAKARTVPQVTGTQMDEAEQALRDRGATNIFIQSVSSDASSGTVVSVEPEEGATFKAADQVVLCVATPYVVPTVMGLTADAAKTAVTKAGLKAQIEYVKSDSIKNTVVESSPTAGTQAKEGDTVTLKVSSPFPEKVCELAGYFDATAQQISTYMTQEKYSITYGSTFSNGDAHVVYMGTDGDTIAFTAYPESPTAEGNARDDVLSKGAPISGVCYTFSSTSTLVGTEHLTTDGIKVVMDACGFGTLKETCTADDLEKLGFAAQGRSFICGYGEMSSYYWAVVIGGSEGTHEVSAMYFPKSHFTGVDLSAYGNSIAKYIAYNYLYDDSAILKKEYPPSTAEETAEQSTEQKEGETSEQSQQTDSASKRSTDASKQQ